MVGCVVCAFLTKPVELFELAYYAKGAKELPKVVLQPFVFFDQPTISIKKRPLICHKAGINMGINEVQ